MKKRILGLKLIRIESAGRLSKKTFQIYLNFRILICSMKLKTNTL
jgi:hypothetical protein